MRYSLIIPVVCIGLFVISLLILGYQGLLVFPIIALGIFMNNRRVTIRQKNFKERIQHARQNYR